VTLRAVLVVPSAWFPKDRLVEESVTDATVPVPDRLTACGLPVALSAMLTEAVSALAREGLKVTLIVQVPPAATELPQVLVWAKSLAFVPAIPTLVMVNVALPPFVRVTLCAVLVVPSAWFPKDRLVEESVTDATAPVPERLTVCGLPLALSVMLTEAARLPLAEGVNVTLIVQLPPAATELPQVLV
jgi:uncharacterized protein YybS (DUF2232 family)